MTVARIDRVLVVHPDPLVQGDLEALLRRVHRNPIVLRHCATIEEGLKIAREHDPRMVFLDLGADKDLIFAISRELKRADRLIVGLYNPLLEGAQGAEFFRLATRAGFNDFVPFPIPEDELAEVLSVVQGATTARLEGGLVTFFGHQGGVGATTLALNTALVLASSGSGERIALCDANLQFGSAASHLGIVPDHDLAHAVGELGEASLTGFLATEPESGLRVLASPSDPRHAEALHPADLTRLLIDLRHRFELVVVDTAPVLDRMTLAALDLAETVLVVTEGSTPIVAGTARLLEMLDELGFPEERVRIVLNRVRSREGFLPPGLVAEQLGRRIDRVIPYDASVSLASHRGSPPAFERQLSDFMEAVASLADDIVRWTTFTRRSEDSVA